jgi:hypothetical protein
MPSAGSGGVEGSQNGAELATGGVIGGDDGIKAPVPDIATPPTGGEDGMNAPAPPVAPTGGEDGIKAHVPVLVLALFDSNSISISGGGSVGEEGIIIAIAGSGGGRVGEDGSISIFTVALFT